jgi:uncharacterized protein YyaL (SSP411 family)
MLSAAMRAFLLLLSAILALPVWAQQAPLRNQLLNHPSPYLALHGGDPTAWQEWNAETVARARREGKLLLLSIGYFSCHWCHVMQRESFRNPQVAAALNRHFIPVKVDRELNGALDAEMQSFAAATIGRSGWPLNVFVTPEGYPLVALLYAPPQDFRRALTRLAERWQKEGRKLAQAAREAAPPQPAPAEAEARFAPQVGVLYRQRLVQEALALADTLRGGFGQTNKFPNSPQLAALLDAQRRAPDPKLAEFLLLTLDEMARLGLRDPIGGGFFRYTVDPDWQVPHFEKMLYDNAQLAAVYLDAATVLGRPDYRRIAFDTLDFMLARMHDAAAGAFITSLSAVDDRGREGGYYLWRKDELQRLLGREDYALVRRIWALDAPPAVDGGYLAMNRVRPSAEEAPRLQAIYTRLVAERARRTLPRDGKLLASLNGLALSALSRAAAEPRYKDAARALRDFLVGRLISAEGLHKGMAAGRLLGPADADDYAYVSQGLLAYAGMAAGKEDRELARKLVEQAWQKFHTPRGWTLDQQPLLARPYYQAVVPDGPSPAPSAVLIRTSWELGGSSLRTHALKALNTGYGLLDQGAFWHATQIGAMSAVN